MSEMFKWLSEPKHNPVPNTGWKTEPEQPAMVQPTEQITLPGQTAPAPAPSGGYTTENQPAPLPAPLPDGGYTTENQPAPLPVPGLPAPGGNQQSTPAVPACPPGQVLVNELCVPLPQQLPPAQKETEEKKTPWGWIALGVAGAAGLVWSLTRGAGEIGGALRANPPGMRAKTFGWYVIVNSERRVLAVYGNQLHDEAAGKLREIQRIGWAELIPVKGSLADKPRVGSILPARYGSGLRANSAFSSLADVKAANKAAGMYWFERETMRFFKTRIESKLLAGDYFITSEQLRDYPRRYSIRQAQQDGSIDTIGKFQGYATKAAAQAAVKELQSRG